jgi:hypothetical protein
VLNWALTGNATGRESSCWGGGIQMPPVNQETVTITT